MIFDWSAFYWLGNPFLSPMHSAIVWDTGSSGAPPPSSGSGQQKMFIGEVQQLGFGNIIDSSTGLT